MDDRLKRFEIILKETPYDGFFKLERLFVRHTLFQGGWSTILKREILRRNDCVAVIPYNPLTDHVVLLEQFRVGAIASKKNPWLVEIVAGIVETGESPRDVAIREAKEEAGCTLLDTIEISQFYTTPGGASEKITLYCGRIDSAFRDGIYGLKEEGEDILATSVSLDQALSYVECGRIQSAIPIIALQWLALHRDQLKDKWSNDD